MLKTLTRAHEIVKELCSAQLDFMKAFEAQFGIPTPKIVYNLPDETLYDIVSDFLTEAKLEILYNTGKKDFQHGLDTLDIEVKNYLLEAGHVAEDADMSFV
jgi:hypothetical protein